MYGLTDAAGIEPPRLLTAPTRKMEYRPVHGNHSAYGAALISFVGSNQLYYPRRQAALICTRFPRKTTRPVRSR
jgi:hypothetical protein